jgi:hypothetical protein
MIYCIDIDETLCHNIEDDYAHSSPCRDAIRKVNALYEDGHTIKLFTGRGSWDSTDWRPFVEKQLKSWGVKYHELIMGKPHADVFIDDKAINSRDWVHNEDSIQEVPRKWGKELWIVNCDEYCSKLLFVPKGAFSEYHYHNKKKETFYCLKGQVELTVSGKDRILDQFSKPVTVMPTEPHIFTGCSNAILLEISTHHSDDDVVFLSEAFNPNK